ncbi:MAG: hypothetical protein E7408_05030 [Ruminococcaceae bacterium]|nr:hypothetical protein [Oscillospiraceae bacterium]
MLTKCKSFLKRNLFLFTMVLSLLIPDIVLRLQLSPSYHAHSHLNISALFTGLWTAFAVLIFVGFLSKKWGRAIYLVFVTVFTAFMIAFYIYFRIFNQYFWLDMMGMTGQAMTYTSYIINNLTFWLFLATAVQIALVVLTCRFWRPQRYKISGLVLLLPLVCLVALHTFLMTEAKPLNRQQDPELERIRTAYISFQDTNRAMHTAGPYQYVFRNLVRMVFPETNYDSKTISEVATFFANKPISDSNAMTGVLEGKNVIMVMLESIDSWMIDKTYTPTMHYMMQNGLNFSNHFSCAFGAGYTFNAEFSANTSYHAPLVGAPISDLTENEFPYTLARAFRAKGYSARELHYNDPDFYNRGKMSEALGYERYVSFLEYIPDVKNAECDSIAIRNKNVYREIVPLQKEPFFSFVVTYSAHLPYTDDNRKTEKIKALYPNLVDRSMDKEINNAMLLAHDTDEFLRILLENLEKDGLLENTVIVAFSDHFAYGVSSWEKLYTLKEAKTTDMLSQTPFFIYCKGMEGQNIEKVTNTLDILPTVVNLLGLEKTPYWLGEDAMDPSYSGYAYFSNGSWYDGEMYYFADEMPNAYQKKDLAYIEKMNQTFAFREKVNEVILRSDYFDPASPLRKEILP